MNMAAVYSILSLAFLCIFNGVLLKCQANAVDIFEENISENLNTEQLTVETSYGAVRGIYLSEARAFLGLPYASSPTGDLRWQPTQEPTDWRPEIYNATEQPAGCPQNCSEPLFVCPTQVSEDCLYMNIYTPLDATQNSDFPVMVYIHGGNFLRSSGASSLQFDGRFIANMSSVVVVTFNYRLGALGWLVLHGDETMTGNYGFLDQIAALRFIKNNIAAFGGDPEKVTLFGQEGGSNAISIHLAHPESNTMFHQAILQSAVLSVPWQNAEEAIHLGNLFKSSLNCSSIKCVKNQSVDSILLAQEQAASYDLSSGSNILLKLIPWGPTKDGKIVMGDSLTWFSDEKVQQKPLILGITSEAARHEIYDIFTTEPSYAVIMGFINLAIPPPNGILALNEYGINIYSTKIRDHLSDGITDSMFVCPVSRAAQSIAAIEDSIVYHYVFNHSLTSFDAWESYDMCKGHACRGTDTMLLFLTASLAGFEYRVAEERLANEMVYYWGNFAHTGNPNNGTWRSQHPLVDVKEWPLYKNESDWQSLLLQTPENVVVSEYRENKCEFWDSIV